MWKNIIESADRSQMAIRRVRIANWIPKARHTHSEYAILIDSYCNNGCTKAPLCWVIRTFPVSFLLHYVLHFRNGGRLKILKISLNVTCS